MRCHMHSKLATAVKAMVQRPRLVWSLGILIVAGAPGVAAATEASGDDVQGSSVEEIVVTGTHLSREGFDAPTPTTVIGEAILETRAPSVLIDAIRYLPQMRGISAPDTAGQASLGPGGQSFINLRALGANRSLVLLNGQRMIATSNTSTVDIGVLPQALINRVDVVTGGASAAYGSDAVAGVVNFVLNTGYVGLKGDIEGGLSAQGDNEEWKTSVLYGTTLGDDLHLVAGGEYYKADGLEAGSRDFAVEAPSTRPNPAYAPGNGQLPLIREPGYFSYLANQTYGGLIVGGPLAGTQFLPGGATSQLDVSACPIRNAGGTYCTPRQPLPWAAVQANVAAPVERGSAYVRLTDEITSTVSVFADVLYGSSKTTYQTVPFNATSAGLLTINNDNAYLPQTIRDQMAANNLTSFQLGRFSRDDGPTVGSREAEVTRASLGMEAEVWNGWTFKPYVSYAQSDFTIGLNNTWITSRFRMAADAVVNPANGQVVCRSTLTDPTNGCVPVNLFGDGSTSDAAHAYYLGNAKSVLTNQLWDVGANLSGDIFSTWAGPISLAVGGEYRSEDDSQVVDAISAVKGFGINNPAPVSGTIEVTEGYIETAIPLAKDLPFAQSAEIHLAGRLTDYSTSGSVETWKVGLNYSPIEDIRFRVTRSRDIRAPNVLELFSPLVQTSGASGIIDPRFNLPTFIRTFQGGNPDLTPEKADTSTIGVVLQPSWLPGFRASLDYYDITIQDAIGTVSPTDVLSGCLAGKPEFCALETRDASGNLLEVTTSFLNLSEIHTEGYDLESEYGFDLDRIRSGWEGRVTLHASANYVPNYRVTNRNGSTQWAGDLVGFALPKWGGYASAAYSSGNWNLLLDTNYIGGGNYSSAQIGQLENNYISGVWYVNAAIQRQLQFGGRQSLLYFNVDNMFDREPPYGFYIGGGIGGGPAYDRKGTRFKLGYRVEF